MAQKPKIEYLGRSYMYGSEAPKIEQPHRSWKSLLPEIKMERFQTIIIDPVGTLCLIASVLLLAILVMGSLHMRQTRAEYDTIKARLSDLKRTNASLSHTYHTSYNLEDIRIQAEKIGMVPGEDTERRRLFYLRKK